MKSRCITERLSSCDQLLLCLSSLLYSWFQLSSVVAVLSDFLS